MPSSLFYAFDHYQPNLKILREKGFNASQLNIEVDVLAKMVEQSLQNLYNEIKNTKESVENSQIEFKELKNEIASLKSIINDLQNSLVKK